MKKYIIGGLIGFVLATAASANAEGVTKLIDQVVQGVFPVTVEGTSIGEAVVIDNKTYLPVREFGEAVGYTVSFTENREVILTKNAEPVNPTPTPIDPTVTPPPVTTVNPRIAEINKELEEWNGNLIIVNKELDEYNKLIGDLEIQKENKDNEAAAKDAIGQLWFQKPRLDGINKKKQMVETEITKLQDELKTIQSK